jgi:hypothetical protein
MLLVDVHRDNMVCEGLHTLTDWDRVKKTLVEPNLVQVVQPELDVHGINVGHLEVDGDSFDALQGELEEGVQSHVHLLVMIVVLDDQALSRLML